MIHPDDAHCFPICRGCREAGVCHLGPSEAVIRAENPRRNWQPNDLGTIRLVCGCLSCPWPEVLDKTLKITKVLCDRHGWVELPKESPKKATGKKSKEQVPGQGDLLDIPPY